MTEKTTEVEHGLDHACYSGGPGEPYFQPYMQCSCGWGLRAETWEAVGAEFDAHLEAEDR